MNSLTPKFLNGYNPTPEKFIKHFKVYINKRPRSYDSIVFLLMKMGNEKTL